jgi:hypothetical protein
VESPGGGDTQMPNFATLGTDITYRDHGSGQYLYMGDGRMTLDFAGFEDFNLYGGTGDDTPNGGPGGGNVLFSTPGLSAVTRSLTPIRVT